MGTHTCAGGWACTSGWLWVCAILGFNQYALDGLVRKIGDIGRVDVDVSGRSIQMPDSVMLSLGDQHALGGRVRS